MPQPVHLQYNSPMQLYSKESAEEQFVQQVGNTAPIALQTADKHFDPAKSATLRYIQDQNHGSFGDRTMDKIAAVEAPRQFGSQEPGWARYAREKSERARSRTPAASEHHNAGYHTPSTTPAPLNHPVHHENAREFAEKQRVYTHNPHTQTYGPSYYQVAEQTRRPRTYSEGARSERGFECGGLDFTKGLKFEEAGGDYYYEHQPRREERSRSRPGYECGGTDFGKGYVAPGPYHGHGPDPPRLRPHYSADPRSPCNAYVASNVDNVDANLLVGDTISNQKIRHEIRQTNQKEFGTSFCPTPGFKRDHITVRHSPGPVEPTTFCVSAPKNVAPRSSAPSDQQNVWMERQQETDREVYTTEPNWSRNVQQRRNAWECKANETDARINLPASAKIAPDAPPAWHNKAVRTHNVWQNAADNMHQVQQQNYQSSYSSQQTHEMRSPQPPPQQYQQNSYQADSRSEVRRENHSTPVHAHYDSGSTNAEKLINSGYNQNQVDYILSHHDKFGPGKKYNPATSNVYQTNDSYQSSNAYKTSSSQLNGHVNNQYQQQQQQHQHQQQQHQQQYQQQQQQQHQQQKQHDTGYSNNYSTTNHEQGQYPEGGSFARTVTESRSSSHTANPVNYSTESHITHAPISQAGHFAPTNFPSSTGYQGSYQKSSNSSKTETQTVADSVPRVIPVQSSQKESFFKSSKSSSSTTETRTVPITPAYTTQKEHSLAESNEKSSESRTLMAPLTPIDTIDRSFQESSYNRTTNTQNVSQPIALPAPAVSPAASYKSYSSSHYSKQEKTTNTTGGSEYQRAPQVTTTLPVTKTTSYSYTSNSQPSQPVQSNISQSSYTNTTEKVANAAPAPANYYSENYSKSHKEESHREETSRPVSQLSQYSESRNYKRNYEEKTETTTIPATLAPMTTNYTSSSSQNASQTASSAGNINDIFNKKKEMDEKLPKGSISNTHNNTEGGYRDKEGHDVSYKRELSTAADPGREYALLKQEEKKVVETPMEPGVISRHVTTKYYKKKTVTDTTTTTVPESQ